MVLMTARGPCAYALPMLGLTEQDFCRAWVSRGFFGHLGGLLLCYPMDGATVLLGCCGVPPAVDAWVLGVLTQILSRSVPVGAGVGCRDTQ